MRAGSDASQGEAPPLLIKRGALTLRTDPDALWWNVARVPLSPMELSLMAALMRHGRLRWDTVDAWLGCSANVRAVVLHRIRRKIAVLGGRDPIETVRGWGVRLRSEADHHASHTIWIGATDADLSRAGSG